MLPLTAAALRNPATISVIIPTYDRPDDLRECLLALCNQHQHPLETIVVDNNLVSGVTAAVVREFPHVTYLPEPRRGVNYARATGGIYSSGDILAFVDDDVLVPTDWVARVGICLERSDAAIVCGDVEPLSLDTLAARWFEAYGGLGNGPDRLVAGPDWLRHYIFAAPTWHLGAGANMAVRRTSFDPTFLPLDPALGTGTPCGGGDDAYLLYCALKSGRSVVYEPDLCVRHKHRSSLGDLRRQIYAYSKGHVAYLLTILVRHADWRALLSLLLGLPARDARNLIRWARSPQSYPFSLVLIEAVGHLVGTGALWKSRRRVRGLWL